MGSWRRRRVSPRSAWTCSPTCRPALAPVDLSAATAVPVNRLTTLVNALGSLGLLMTNGDTRANAPACQRYLVRGAPSDFRGLLPPSGGPPDLPGPDPLGRRAGRYRPHIRHLERPDGRSGTGPGTTGSTHRGKIRALGLYRTRPAQPSRTGPIPAGARDDQGGRHGQPYARPVVGPLLDGPPEGIRPGQTRPPGLEQGRQGGYSFGSSGGAEGIRTPDPLDANEVRYRTAPQPLGLGKVSTGPRTGSNQRLTARRRSRTASRSSGARSSSPTDGTGSAIATGRSRGARSHRGAAALSV